MLKVSELSLQFHDHTLPETVVDRVSFAVEPGEVVGLVGESGSGKSLTAHAIAGLLNRRDLKKSGQILFEGTDILTCPEQELRRLQGNRIGIIFQEPLSSLNPVYRIGWQVEESLRIHRPGMSAAERKARAMSLLRDVELADTDRIYQAYPHQLSGGQRQRVMIAAAMICEPALLIADEPTTALDVTVQLQIVRLLQRINREQNTAILFISHDLSLVKRLCGRILVMKEGSIVEEGGAEQIFSAPREAYTKELIAAIPRCVRMDRGIARGGRQDG